MRNELNYKIALYSTQLTQLIINFFASQYVLWIYYFTCVKCNPTKNFGRAMILAGIASFIFNIAVTNSYSVLKYWLKDTNFGKKHFK